MKISSEPQILKYRGTVGIRIDRTTFLTFHQILEFKKTKRTFLSQSTKLTNNAVK